MPTFIAGLLGLLLATASTSLASLLGDPEAAAQLDYCVQRVEAAATQAAVESALDEAVHKVPAREQAAALLIKSGQQLAASNPAPRACRRTFDEGDTRFDRALAKRLRQVRRNDDFNRVKMPRLAEVQSLITTQWVADQAGRLAYLDLATKDRSGAAFWAQRRATAHALLTDAASAAVMRALLEEFDWIDSDRFGQKVATRAWLLVQHADQYPDIQRSALERMAAYLDDGKVRRRDFAYLWDRVAINAGQKQRYGTQPTDTCNPDASLDLKPVEDPDGLDARRRAMGLGPAAADLAQMAAQRCSSHH